MYDPIPRPARPFEADYPATRWPDGPPADASRRLTRDIDGRPINPGARIVGRRMVDGPDKAITPEKLVALAEATTGARPLAVAPGERGLPRTAIGVYRKERGTRVPEWDRPWNYDPPFWEDGTIKSILLSNKMSPDVAGCALGHEVAHRVEDIVGTKERMVKRIPSRELDTLPETETRAIYGELSRGLSPENFRYKPEDVRGELNAEAIRKAVNSHPVVSRHIPFNSGGLLVPIVAVPAEDRPTIRRDQPRRPQRT